MSQGSVARMTRVALQNSLRRRPPEFSRTRSIICLAIILLISADCQHEPVPTVDTGKGAVAAGGQRAASSGGGSAFPASAFPKPNRPVAAIVSASWDNEDARDRVGEADTVMSLLGIGTGMSVADIGAGSGYYTVRLSPRVGASGSVYAEDIMPEYLKDLRARVEKGRATGLGNVNVVLGTADNPRLPAAAIDRALFVHMYHEIEQPYALLYNLHPALKPGALVGIVDVDRATSSHGTPPAQLKCEMTAAGYEQVRFHGLAVGYLAVYRPLRQSSPDDVRAAVARPQFRERRC